MHGPKRDGVKLCIVNIMPYQPITDIDIVYG